jgi:hypothetical protein
MFHVCVPDCQLQTETLGSLNANQTESNCNNNSTGSIVIPNGVGCFEGNVSGSVISYQCDEGYMLVGYTNQTCLSEGVWSGGTPKCQMTPGK